MIIFLIFNSAFHIFDETLNIINQVIADGILRKKERTDSIPHHPNEKTSNQKDMDANELLSCHQYSG